MGPPVAAKCAEPDQIWRLWRCSRARAPSSPKINVRCSRNTAAPYYSFHSRGRKIIKKFSCTKINELKSFLRLLLTFSSSAALIFDQFLLFNQKAQVALTGLVSIVFSLFAETKFASTHTGKHFFHLSFSSTSQSPGLIWQIAKRRGVLGIYRIKEKRLIHLIKSS
jgi:hypothetical protein